MKGYSIGPRESLNALQQNNSEIVTNKHDKEIPKEIYISPEERQKIINDLIQQYNDRISKNNKFFRQCTKSIN